MYLYNSASHKKEEFIPNHPELVKMYTCGPTVYHFAHIGNLRSYIMEDVLEKFLRYEGRNVKRVMNITDVGHLSSDADTGEDKMLQGAKREQKSVMDIAAFYTDAFFDDCRKLNIKRPDVVEPATNCIGEYIHIISGLIEKGYAYLSGGNVYFDTSKLDRYYIFNDHDAEDLAVGVREGVEEDANKRNKNDFVLWFTQSKFEDQALKWDSLGHKWCNYWMHVLHLNTNSGKMSKSKGEFLTVSLLEEKGYDPLAYRLFCLQSHYRKALVFTWENLDNAQGAYNKLIARIASLKPGDGAVDEAAFQAQKEKFCKAMGNDLNTSLGVTALYDVLKMPSNDETKLALLDSFDQVLSLGLLEKAAARREADANVKTAASGGIVITGEGDPEIDALVLQRAEAKKAKNFAEADRIRDELKARGITVTDTKEGASWKRD